MDGLDNHWLDGVVGCAVAASIQGVELPQMKFNRPKHRRVTFAEMRQRREQERQAAAAQERKK